MPELKSKILKVVKKINKFYIDDEIAIKFLEGEKETKINYVFPSSEHKEKTYSSSSIKDFMHVIGIFKGSKKECLIFLHGAYFMCKTIMRK